MTYEYLSRTNSHLPKFICICLKITHTQKCYGNKNNKLNEMSSLITPKIKISSLTNLIARVAFNIFNHHIFLGDAIKI